MINLEFLESIKSCDPGIKIFLSIFGDRSVSVYELFEKMPHAELLWFSIHSNIHGKCPKPITDSVPVEFKLNRKSPYLMYIKKNPTKFMTDVMSHPEAREL